MHIHSYTVPDYDQQGQWVPVEGTEMARDQSSVCSVDAITHHVTLYQHKSLLCIMCSGQLTGLW